MKRIIVSIFCILIFSTAYAESTDPMGLSDYVVQELHSDGTWHDRRMTNHEVDLFRAVGEILPDGSVLQHANVDADPTIGDATQITRKPLPNPVAASNKTPSPKHSAYMKEHKDKKAIAHYSPNIHKIKKKPKPSRHEIAKQTKTKHKDHPKSKGLVEVRPTNFPKNPTHDDIVRMQQHIQHIERTVGKALDLSLSAYAVAELPQATEGRSGISVGVSNAEGKPGAAVGYSSNFGEQHEYTIKISLSHAGHTDAVGAGFGWQW